MSFKTVIAHIEPNQNGRRIARAASALAAMFGGGVVGVGARSCLTMIEPLGISAGYVKRFVEADLAEAKRIFEAEAPGIGCEWYERACGPTEAVLQIASVGDVIVAGRGVEPEPEETRAGAADLIMGSGLPVLVVPDEVPTRFRTALIAWKDTREARRAVSDALPCLKLAERVVLARVAHDGSEKEADLADMLGRLRRHGIAAEARMDARFRGSVAEQIADTASGIDADLLVLGGYGHSRVREWALGGVTHYMLEHTPVCSLFSH